MVIILKLVIIVMGCIPEDIVVIQILIIRLILNMVINIELEDFILNLKESIKEDIIILVVEVEEVMLQKINYINFIIAFMWVDINILLHSYLMLYFEIHIDLILYIRLFLQLDRIMEIVDILNWALKYLIEIEIVIELMIQKNILELSLLLILDIYQI
ncbi:MAG: hypothetical protein EZS28_056509, partial [Streblomastix strix]